MHDGIQSYFFFVYLFLFCVFRFNVDLTPYPLMVAIEERLNQLPAFKNAHPNHQPDYPGEN